MSAVLASGDLLLIALVIGVIALTAGLAVACALALAGRLADREVEDWRAGDHAAARPRDGHVADTPGRPGR